MIDIFNLYSYWKPVKDVFVKPKLHCYFGKWMHNPCLPMWRHGYCIKLAKYEQYYIPNNCVNFKVGEEYNDALKMNISKYDTSYHKLPTKPHQYVWKSPIRRKLRKLKLSWIPPYFYLPRWMYFNIFKSNLGWKTKWEEFRYEWPPQITFVFFGLSLSFWITPPKTNDDLGMPDNYWEAILYYSDNKDLKKTINKISIWKRTKDNIETSYFGVRPEYINKEYLEEYYKITSEIKRKKNKIAI